MARHNLAALGMEADLCRADVLHPVTRDAVVVIDPARRSNGRRRFHLADYQPGLGPYWTATAAVMWSSSALPE